MTLSGPDGLYTVSVIVTDVAGNATVLTQTIWLVTVGPAISYTMSASTNNGSYDTGLVIAFSYIASSIANVASITATLDATTAVASGAGINVDTLTAGAHTIVITATDQLGNKSTTTISFQVHATIPGQINAVNQGVAAGQITSSVGTYLVSILNNAQNSLKAGNVLAAKSNLQSYINYVKSRTGAGITSAYAALLISWAQDLYNRL
jgi:hypothetical protein